MLCIFQKRDRQSRSKNTDPLFIFCTNHCKVMWALERVVSHGDKHSAGFCSDVPVRFLRLQSKVHKEVLKIQSGYRAAMPDLPESGLMAKERIVPIDDDDDDDDDDYLHMVVRD